MRSRESLKSLWVYGLPHGIDVFRSFVSFATEDFYNFLAKDYHVNYNNISFASASPTII